MIKERDIMDALTEKGADDPVNQPQLRAKPRASGLAECARQQRYMMTNTPVTNPPSSDSYRYATKYTQEQGTQAEDITVDALHTLGIEVTNRQIELPEGFWTTGHPDGEIEVEGDLIHGHPDTLIYGFEHKVYGWWKYLQIWQESQGTDLTAGEHGRTLLTQVLCYADALDWDGVYVYIVSQDASAIRNKLMEYQRYANSKKAETRAKWEWALNPNIPLKVQTYSVDLTGLRAKYTAGLQKRAEWIAQDIPPEQVFREGDKDPATANFPCTWCDWKDRCIADGLGHKQAPPNPVV